MKRRVVPTEFEEGKWRVLRANGARDLTRALTGEACDRIDAGGRALDGADVLLLAIIDF